MMKKSGGEGRTVAQKRGTAREFVLLQGCCGEVYIYSRGISGGNSFSSVFLKIIGCVVFFAEVRWKMRYRMFLNKVRGGNGWKQARSGIAAAGKFTERKNAKHL